MKKIAAFGLLLASCSQQQQPKQSRADTLGTSMSVDDAVLDKALDQSKPATKSDIDQALGTARRGDILVAESLGKRLDSLEKRVERMETDQRAADLTRAIRP